MSAVTALLGGIGLTGGNEVNVHADLAWTPTADRAVTAFAAYGRVRTRQAGSRAFSTPDWWADNRDDSATLGLTVEQRDLVPALDVSAGYTLVESHGRTVLDDAGRLRPFPQVRSRSQGLGLRGKYRLRPGLGLALVLRHERYHADDWQRDGIDASTVPNLLATGFETPDYRLNLVYVTILWQFGGVADEAE